MNRMHLLAPLFLALICLAVGCATSVPSFQVNHNAAATSKPGNGPTLDYLCPDVFEGHIFSCPTVPVVQAALDRDTDSFGLGVELACKQHHGGVCVSPGIEFGLGSEELYSPGFGDFEFAAQRAVASTAVQTALSDHTLDYTVLQLKAQGRYGFVVGGDSAFTVSPIAGPRIYRFAYKDCPFAFDCSETLIVLDVGVGLQYKNFGVDIFTGIGGPNFMTRFKYLFAH